MRAAADLVRDVEQDPCLRKSLPSKIIEQQGWRQRHQGNKQGRDEGRTLNGWERRWAQKGREYRVHQHMYHSDPGKLAALVLDGKKRTEYEIPTDEIFGAFQSQWEDEREFLGLGQFQPWTTQTTNDEFGVPILAAEVKANLTKMKNSSAPGPDGISKKALLDRDPQGEQLARLFTTWLVQGKISKAFKECRTTLLPKSNDKEELRTVSGWCPMTISSLVPRLLSGIMTMRLTRACPLNTRQRGFLASAGGCVDNLMILQGIMKHSWTSGSPLGVVFVDFAKAFDSISHENMLSALTQRNVDQLVIELVKDSRGLRDEGW